MACDASLRNKGIEGRLLYASIAPVAAIDILPGLSFAAGPTLNYSTVKLRSGVGLVEGDTFRYTGHGTALGAKLGIRLATSRSMGFRRKLDQSYDRELRWRLHDQTRNPGKTQHESVARLSAVRHGRHFFPAHA